MTDDLHSLAAAYALDALDPLERRRFEHHYPDCESCSAEVAGFRETAARLGSEQPVQPPGDLRRRVLEEVSATQQLPAAAPPRPLRRVAGFAAAAAAVVALLGAGVVLGRTTAPEGAGELAAVLSAPDAVTLDLDADAAPGGVLRVAFSAEEGGAVLLGSGLEDPGPESTYQLWTIDDDGPRSAGTFGTDGGTVRAEVDLPEGGAATWAVTREPVGGSPQPTGDILYVGSLA